MRRLSALIIFIAIFFSVNVAAAKDIRPITLHDLPEHMESYHNYMIVFIHGMASAASCWNGEESAELNLMEYVKGMLETSDSAELEMRMYVDTFEEPCGPYHDNGPQLGDRYRNSDNCWLEKARNSFISKFKVKNGRDPEEDEIPKKYIFITHSMGSLSARSYIYSSNIAASGVDQDNFKGDFYQNDVKKVVFLSPTHRGSSNAEFMIYYLHSMMRDFGVVDVKTLIEVYEKHGVQFVGDWEKIRAEAKAREQNRLRKLESESKQAGCEEGIEIITEKQQDELGTVIVSVELPQEIYRQQVNDLIKIYFELDQNIISNNAATKALVTEQQKLKNYLILGNIEYGFEGNLGYSIKSKNTWLNQEVVKGYAVALPILAEDIYKTILIESGKEPIQNILRDLNQENANLASFSSFQMYLNQQIAVQTNNEIKNLIVDFREYNSTFNSYLELNNYIERNYGNADFKREIDKAIRAETDFLNWAAFKEHYAVMICAEDLEMALQSVSSIPVVSRTSWPDLKNGFKSLITSGSAVLCLELEKWLEQLAVQKTDFSSWLELEAFIDGLDVQTSLINELNDAVAQHTVFSTWNELHEYLARSYVAMDGIRITSLDIAQHSNNKYESWLKFHDYLKTVAIKNVMYITFLDYLNTNIGFTNWIELKTHLNTVSFTKAWEKAFLKIQYELEKENCKYILDVEAQDGWLAYFKPRTRLFWFNWTQIDLDMKSIVDQNKNDMSSYRQSIKSISQERFQSRLEEIKENYQVLAILQNPIVRLIPLLMKIGLLPANSEEDELMLETCNMIGPGLVTELASAFLDAGMFKKQLEGGAVASLLPSNPMTNVLRSAELPRLYDPISYRNIVARGSIAFDKRATDQTNLLLYLDIPPLNAVLAQMQPVAIVPDFMVNAYTIQIKTSRQWSLLPSGQAKLLSLYMGSALKTMFTEEGDFAVDIGSMRGEGVYHLRNAKNYEYMFVCDDVNNYIEDILFDEVEAINASICLLKLFMPVPTVVEGAMRYLPIGILSIKVLNNTDELVDSAVAHLAIPKQKYSGELVRDAIIDNPLIVCTGIFTVSGNEKERLSVKNYQPQTEEGQFLSSMPIQEPSGAYYAPLAFNIAKPLITVEGVLRDFAPQACTARYSYNFAAFKELPLINNKGEFRLENLLVAEGQNILLIEAINMLGKKTTQFIRIIRSSSPLLPSNLYPPHAGSVNTENVEIQLDFYNAQFVTNNIEVTELTMFKVDGVPVPLNEVIQERGYINAYCNRLNLKYVAKLEPGEHSVEVAAEDSYSHQIYGRWSFVVDLEAPTAIVNMPNVYSPSANSEPVSMIITLGDNVSQMLRDVRVDIYNNGNALVHTLMPSSKKSVGAHVVQWDGQIQGVLVADGLYTIRVRAQDQAGNQIKKDVQLRIDASAPEIITFELQKKEFSRNDQKLSCVVKIKDVDCPTTNTIRFFNQKNNVAYVFSFDLKKDIGDTYAGLLEIENLDNQFVMRDGVYEVYLIAEDRAGNKVESEKKSIIIDTTPPVIYNSYASPLVLTQKNAIPYATTYFYQVRDDTSVTTSAKPKRVLKAYAKIVNKSTQAVEAEFFNLPISSMQNSFAWKPNESSLKNGVYQIKMFVEDLYGNCAESVSEVIKDGIFPIILKPYKNDVVQGNSVIYGTVSDADWTNTKEFESYEVYVAQGVRAMPEDLNNLGAEWKTSGLEVPFVNQKYNQSAKNISYRTVQEGALVYWDTTLYLDGYNTMLIVGREKDLGATSGVTRTFIINNLSPQSTLVPHAYVLSAPVSVNFANEAEVKINCINVNKTADISVSLLDPNGEIVKHNYFKNIEGAQYFGKPEYFSGQEKGVYVWEDAAGWHLRINAAASQNYHIEGSLIGVDSVRVPTNCIAINPAVYSGMAQISANIVAGNEYGFDFDLMKGATALYINIDSAEGTPAAEAKYLFIGHEKHNPKLLPFVISIDEDSNKSLFTMAWDGKDDSGKFVNNGVYTIRIAAAGADGSGYRISTTTLNVQTPFEFLPGSISPADGSFGVFSVVDEVCCKYNINKDSYINANIYEAVTHEKVCQLFANKKVLGSKTDKSVTWNGAYPEAGSTQRKIGGEYYLRLTVEPIDSSAVQEAYTYNSIAIRESAGMATANLALIGEEVKVNGNPVRSTAGATDYYLAARAEGTYYEPTPFIYEVRAKGEQVVSINPFVPFALLYHRGFDRVKFRIAVNYEWEVEYKRNSGADWETMGEGWEYYNHYVDLSSSQKNATSESHEASSGWRISNLDYDYVNPSATKLEITVQDVMGNTMAETIKLNKGSYKGLILQGALYIDVSVYCSYNKKYGRCHSYSRINNCYLVDDIKYSRLTNRYYAWYGWVNKNTKRTMDFGSMYKDLCKLGFPGSSYFINPSYFDNPAVLLRHNFSFAHNERYDLNEKIIDISELKAAPVIIAGEWSNEVMGHPSILINEVPTESTLVLRAANGKPIAEFPCNYPGVNNVVDSKGLFKYDVSYESKMDIITSFPLTGKIIWRPIIKITLLNEAAFKELTKGLDLSIEATELFDFSSETLQNFNDEEKVTTYKDFLQKQAQYGTLFKEDPTYKYYLFDEYTEIIPIIPMGGSYALNYDGILDTVEGVPGLISKVQVGSDYSLPKTISWPMEYEEIVADENESIRLLKQRVATDEIFSQLDLTDLCYTYDVNSINFGGINEARFIINGAISKRNKGYLSKPLTIIFKELRVAAAEAKGVQDLSSVGSFPDSVINNSIELSIFRVSSENIDLYFDGTNKARQYSLINNSHVRIQGDYSNLPNGDEVYEWSSEMDPQLTDGLLAAGPFQFNEFNYSPKSETFYLSDFYNYDGQVDDIMTNYLFLEHERGITLSGRALNTNLDITTWNIEVYDQTMQKNQDLEVVDVLLSNEKLEDNNFKVKLKLDAIEKRYVELKGSVSGPYELLYFNGDAWQSICCVTENAVIENGHLAWWDVGRLNGQHTVALKVYDGVYGSSNFNVTTQEVYIGTLLEKAASSNTLVYCPYKRASVSFAPGCYNDDKFITVTPVEMKELNIDCPPDIASIGPIAEILPHGSTFDAQHKPTLIFNYSAEDISILKNRGVDPADLHIYYINEKGGLEAANSIFSFITANNTYQITAELSHFSPYTILEGVVPKMPQVYAANSIAKGNMVRIYGYADKNCTLNIYVDDDGFYGNEDVSTEKKEISFSTKVSDWIFNNRNYGEDYVKKLEDEEQGEIRSQRSEQAQKIASAAVSNNIAVAEWKEKLISLQTVEQDLLDSAAQEIETCKPVASEEIIDAPEAGKPDNDVLAEKEVNANLQALIYSQRTNTVGSAKVYNPEYNSCLPEKTKPIEVINYHQVIERLGALSKPYSIKTNSEGFYSIELDLLNVPTTSIFVAYEKEDRVKNTPVAHMMISKDPNAPEISTLNVSRKIVNFANKNEPIKVFLSSTETGKLGMTCSSKTGIIVANVLQDTVKNTAAEFEIDCSQIEDGYYTYVFYATDEAGNNSFPYSIDILVDTTFPQAASLNIPSAYNPHNKKIDMVYASPEQVTLDVVIKNASGNVVCEKVGSKNISLTDFEPSFARGEYINNQYEYNIVITDLAGNSTLTTGSFLVDTIAPEIPQNFQAIGRKDSAYVLWNSSTENSKYIIKRLTPRGGIQKTYSIQNNNTFNDTHVTQNNFYYYTINAQDSAGNTSATSDLKIVYVAANTDQLLCKENESAELAYLNFKALVPTGAVREQNLFVMQLLRPELQEVQEPSYIGQALIGKAIRMLASERSNFYEYITLEFDYSNVIITNNIMIESLRFAYWDGANWVSEGLIDQKNDTQNMVVSAKTNHFTEFAVIANKIPASFDNSGPQLTFDDLRENDFFDVQTTTSISIKEDNNPIVSSDMRLEFDGVLYNVPQNQFVQSGPGFGGKVYFNLSNIVPFAINEGTHVIRMTIYDLAANTSNASVRFDYEDDFIIREVVNVPNPFDEDGTYFTYQLSKPASKIEIKIYDTNGRLLQEMGDDVCPKEVGFNKVRFDGRDRWGDFLANDVYFYLVLCEDPDGERHVLKRKMVVMQ